MAALSAKVRLLIANDAPKTSKIRPPIANSAMKIASDAAQISISSKEIQYFRREG